MKHSADKKSKRFPAIKALCIAVTANTLIASYCHAGPTGGTVTDGDGSITQSDSHTRIDQNSHRLALDWDTFNVESHERVEFVQPSSDATALNRILDSNGSRILGQIDANGHVILMNPNGIFFGQGAKVNVGGLIASGLSTNSTDFMNGELAFAGVTGTVGTVINRGIINAATGGNVALIGKRTENHGLISANLGHVALASGAEAVVTFDDQGLIGVRIDKETLTSEVGGDYATKNTGKLIAAGGKVLLNASVSADLFSEAVNHGGMNGSTRAVVHDDGSFTLGGGRNVVNTGTVNVSTDGTSSDNAGYVVIAGSTVDQRGTILANADGDNLAGQVYAEASDRVNLSQYSTIEANNTNNHSGKVSLDANQVAATAGAKTTTSGDTVISAIGLITTPEINTHNLFLQSVGTVSQAGSAKASGNTHLTVAAGADVDLTHMGNDFNTFSLDAQHTSTTHLTDSNDLTLGTLDIFDSSLHVVLTGDGATLSQSTDTNIRVDGSELHLTADNVILGGDNNHTHVSFGDLFIDFTQEINTNQSITIGEEHGIYPNSVRITGTGDNGRVELRSTRAIDLVAGINTSNELRIGNMEGDTALLEGLLETLQTGPIQLSDTLTWNAFTATLDHPENDIAAIAGTGTLAFGRLTYVDKNDVTIRDMNTVSESDVNIRSVGAGGHIRQAPNTQLNADFIELSADNISLGAEGSSEVNAGYLLNIAFGQALHINGPYSVGSGFYAPVLKITGNETNNKLTLGDKATIHSFAEDDLLATIDISLGEGNDIVVFDSEFITGNNEYYERNRLDLGAGHDQIYINKDMYIPVTLGTGRDYMRIWNFSTHFDVTDFTYREDRLWAHSWMAMRK